MLVDQKGHVLSTGYNGPASGEPHCIDHPCPGANLKSGTGLDVCEAIHAEANALLQCRDPWAINTCYVTASPCVHCVKLLMNTSCRRVVFMDEYPQAEAKVLWLSVNERMGAAWRQWVRMDVENSPTLWSFRNMVEEYLG